jgi:hypothetical protein
MKLPKVSIWSQFRDDAGNYLRQYRQRVEALDYPAENLRFYLGEGDSTDNTWTELCAWYLDDIRRVVCVQRHTGRQRFWHTPRPERMKTLATTGNAVWDRIAMDGWSDYALMLESDLLYTPDLLARLVWRMPKDAAAIAPMIWVPVGEQMRFYDIWAFRQDGKQFPPYPPAWYAEQFGEQPFEIDAAGSVILFRMDYIKQGARLSETTAVVGMCEQIRAMGGKIYCDPETHVIHPIVEGVK